MNWYGVTGTGTHAAAGNRTGTADQMCGDAVMYDAIAGKILVVGGAPLYSGECTFSVQSSSTHTKPVANAILCS